MNSLSPRLSVAVALSLAVHSGVAAAGEILINPVDKDGVGFNDTTPANPVGGNPGITLGAQRLAAYKFAAQVWTGILEPENDIVVQATFAPLPCDEESGVLGAAGTIQVFANFEGVHGFPGALWPETWSHAALSNQLAGEDLSAGDPDPGLLAPPFNDDIVSFFNGDIDTNDECLTGTDWYYGLDHNADPATQIDFLNVLMHELGHGLGFASFIDDENGQAFSGRPDVFSVFVRNNTTGLKMNQQNNGEREASAINTGKLVWTGPLVTDAAQLLLVGVPLLHIESPDAIKGDVEVQEASYGLPVPEGGGVTGVVVRFTGDLACNLNVGADPNIDTAVDGKIALITRGSCAFAEKSLNAQKSGAIAVLISNNQPTGLPPMGGSDIEEPTVVSVGISMADGDRLRANPGAVGTILRSDDPTQLAGADAEGFVKIYAPNPVEPGSSGSHWDVTATPNLLMEPFISDSLRATDPNDGVDLTDEQMRDVGWDGVLHCPLDTDDRADVQVGDCETGVPNLPGPFTTRFLHERQGVGNGTMDIMGGCYLQDLVTGCLVDGTTGNANSCLVGVTNELEKAGVLSDTESSSILSCLD